MPKRPNIEILIPLQCDHQRQDELLQNSIERVINTTINNYLNLDRELTQLEDINLQDWTELKVLVVDLFNAARNEVFKARQQEETKA